jgi:hypothetical protein
MNDYKIVQSFWTKPFLHSIEKKKAKGGSWLNNEMFLISNCLSVLKLKEFYSNVELVTDDLGAKILIDDLGLPYDKVNTSLNEINNYRPELWAVGKIKAYAIQDEPFLHIDNDIFIWKEFEEELLSKALICQNFENNVEYYALVTEEIQKNNFELPVEMKSYVEAKATLNNFEGINAGIIGGCDIDFFKMYTRKAFEIIDKNYSKLDLLPHLTPFNVFFEQALFYSLSIEKNMPIEPYINLPISKTFSELVKIHDVPRTSYIHPVSTWKKSLNMNEFIYMTFKENYPEYYEKVKKTLRNNQYELF